MILSNRNDILTRAVSEIIVEDEFVERLDSGIPLRLKMGFDPSAPDIHLGHAVGLRKLRQLQPHGHKVILIVGDWTAQIGDPSGRSQTRQMLAADEVQRNAETYLTQFFKIVDRDQTEIRWQSEWFGAFTIANVIELTSKFTVAQILAREDFSKRFAENHPIAITELLYPLLQAFDSVAIEADVEFGGLDQKFNLLVGRELQEAHNMSPQQCFLLPLLPGTDGKKKMSKSLGNYIGIAEPTEEIYGKVMSIPATLIMPYYEWLTNLPTPDLNGIRRELDEANHNMDLKKNLAHTIIADLFDKPSADVAQGFFEQTVQNKLVPNDIPEYQLPSDDSKSDMRLTHIMVKTGLTSSTGNARRLINQGAVYIDNTPLTDNLPASQLSPGILRAGRRKYLRLMR